MKAGRHGVCGIEVIKGLEVRWGRWRDRWEEVEKRRREEGKQEDSTVIEGTEELLKAKEMPIEAVDDKAAGRQAKETQPANTSTPAPSISPNNPYQPLVMSELPRRLFRVPSQPKKVSKSKTQSRPSTSPKPSSSMLSPILLHLFENYEPSPNSHKGYPLCRAVLASDIQLVKFLLENGADPGLNDGLALQIAVSKKDLGLVRLLMEKQESVGSEVKQEIEDVMVPNQNSSLKRKRGDEKDVEASVSMPMKKVRTTGRVRVTPMIMKKVMQSGSREMVDYFIEEKGEGRMRFVSDSCLGFALTTFNFLLGTGYMPSLTSIMAWQ